MIRKERREERSYVRDIVYIDLMRMYNSTDGRIVCFPKIN